MHRFSTKVIWGRRLRMTAWGFRNLNHWGQGGSDLPYFFPGDDAFALMPWMVKYYSRRQLTGEERIANYRISRGRRVVENAFRILMSLFSLLLGIIMQRPRVVRDIVFTCVVLHNMLRTHQGSVDRVPKPSKWCSGCTKWTGSVCAKWELQESFEGGQRSTRTTERLIQSCGHIGWAGRQDVR